MNAIAKLSLALGASLFLIFPASTQAFDPPHRSEWSYHHHHYQGLKITSIAYRSPAQRAGLERGDVILEVDGRDVVTGEALHRALHHTGFRGTLTVRDARTGRINRVQVYPDAGHIGVTVAPVAW